MKRMEPCNSQGVRWTDDATEVHVKEVRVYDENGSVQLWFTLAARDFLVYLTPAEAISFSKAFERCAIAALKESNQ